MLGGLGFFVLFSLVDYLIPVCVFISFCWLSSNSGTDLLPTSNNIRLPHSLPSTY